MKIKEHLVKFYIKNNIPLDRGIVKKTFEIPVLHVKFDLPNFSWRKSRSNIRDVEHIVNYQDTSCKGEIFIASWEIAVGYWRSFPRGIFPFWIMGFGSWRNPAAVRNGFYKGLSDRSITELKMSREELMEMDLIQLQIFIENTGVNFSFWQKFLLYIISVVVSQIIFLLPFVLCGLYLFKNYTILL